MPTGNGRKPRGHKERDRHANASAHRKAEREKQARLAKLRGDKPKGKPSGK